MVAREITEFPIRAALLRKREPIQDVPLRVYGERTGWLLFAAIAILGVGTIIVSLSSYSRKETVFGSLTPMSGAVDISSPRPGVVSVVHVREGDFVQAGAPIVTLTTDVDVEGGRIGDLIADATDAQESAVMGDIVARREILARSQDEVSERRDRLKEEIRNVDAQLTLMGEQLKMAEDTIERARPAHEAGYISTIQFRQWEVTRIQAALSKINLEQKRETASRDLQKVDIDEGRLVAQKNQLDAELAKSKASLLEKRVSLAGQSGLIVKADKAGRIAALQAVRGRVVAPGQPFATLLPEGSQLVADLWIPSSAIGFVKTGDPVRFMYDGFPYQNFGMAAGRVILVSNAPIAPQNLPPTAIAQAQGQAKAGNLEPLYQVRASLDKQAMKAYGKDWPLLPGMKLSAIIILEKRTVVKWILDPILAARARSAV